MIVHVKNNHIVKIEGDPEHPVNKGNLCPKGEAATELVNDKNRLKHPLIKVKDKWRKASWDEALTLVANKLRETAEKHGPKSVVIMKGQAPGHMASAYYWERFCNVFGTPNYMTGAWECYWGKLLAFWITCGGLPFPMYHGITGFREDYAERTKCMILWGANPINSGPPGGDEILELKRKGAKLIVVDPRRTELAEEADIWVQIRPGTDAALALGMINEIITRKLYDEDFVSKYTVGFEKLAERAKQYPPEKVEKICWVPTESIEEIAEIYATNKPGFIDVGIAVEHQNSGFQAQRAIACLMGLTGNLDIRGGNLLIPYPPKQNISLGEMPVDGEPLGADKYPLMVRETFNLPHSAIAGVGKAHGAVLLEAIGQGEVKAMILVGISLLTQEAETKIWRDTLNKLDFLTVIDLYEAGYGDLADVLLPTASYLERDDLLFYGGVMGEPYLAVREKCVNRWECWEDWKICFELGKKLGYEQYFPWKGIEEAMDEELKTTGLKSKDLKGKTGVSYMHIMEYNKYQKGLETPSGKIEFYSSIMEKHGYDPLPSYNEPDESPYTIPKLTKEYPLILTTGQRILYYTHSQYRTLPSLRKEHPYPLVEIHPVAANTRGISDGEWVIIKSPRGEAKAKAKITNKIHPKVVSLSHGWSSPSNANELTSSEHLDLISGCPSLKALLCEVKKF